MIGFRTGTHQPENDNVRYCGLYTTSGSMTNKVEPAPKIDGIQHFLNKHPITRKTKVTLSQMKSLMKDQPPQNTHIRLSNLTIKQLMVEK